MYEAQTLGGDVTWGYGHGEFNNPRGSDEFYYGLKTPGKHADLGSEIILTAAKLQDTFRDDSLVLGFDGSYESQAIALAFKTLEQPVILVMVVYHLNGDVINLKAYQRAEAFCRRHALALHTVPVDLLTRVPALQQKARQHYALPWHKYLLLEALRGRQGHVLILGGGLPTFTLKHNHALDTEVGTDLTGIALRDGSSVVSQFFTYRSELLYSYLDDEVVKRFGAFPVAYLRERGYDETYFERHLKPLVFAAAFGDALEHGRDGNGVTDLDVARTWAREFNTNVIRGIRHRSLVVKHSQFEQARHSSESHQWFQTTVYQN